MENLKSTPRLKTVRCSDKAVGCLVQPGADPDIFKGGGQKGPKTSVGRDIPIRAFFIALRSILKGGGKPHFGPPIHDFDPVGPPWIRPWSRL